MIIHYELTFGTQFEDYDYDYDLYVDDKDISDLLYEILQEEGMEEDKIDDYVKKHFDELCDKYYEDLKALYEKTAIMNLEEEYGPSLYGR